MAFRYVQRRVRVRKSENTQVCSAVVEAYSWPAWVLGEQRVPAVFGQVRDAGEVQRVEVQPGAQPERVAGGGEPLVQGADLVYPGPAGIKDISSKGSISWWNSFGRSRPRPRAGSAPTCRSAHWPGSCPPGHGAELPGFRSLPGG
jgi:hypothetical protein